MSEDEQKKSDLQSLTERLNALKKQRSGGNASDESTASFGRWLWIGFNVVSDLIAGVVCGLGIGYGLDRWLGTRPVFIAVFLIFGCAGGLLNAVRFIDDRQRKEEQADTRQKEE